MRRDELVELCELCRESVSLLDVLERGDTTWAADMIIDDVIDELQNDPNIPKRSHYDWFVELGDLHHDIGEQLAELTKDHVQLRLVLRTIIDELEGRDAT